MSPRTASPLTWLEERLETAIGSCCSNPERRIGHGNLRHEVSKWRREGEAPTNIAWSVSNRSAMIRIPARRGNSTRAELRMPDPSANPYLALAAMAAAGMDGLKRRLDPPPPINRNIYEMSVRDRRKHKIKDLPANLREAVGNLKRDKVIIDALGDHVYKGLVDAKTQEYDEYRIAVHQWELDRYLAEY